MVQGSQSEMLIKNRKFAKSAELAGKSDNGVELGLL
jgi:hypothetical protein